VHHGYEGVAAFGKGYLSSGKEGKKDPLPSLARRGKNFKGPLELCQKKKKHRNKVKSAFLDNTISLQKKKKI